MNKKIRCVCGAWYEFYNMTIADQSMCPACIQELNRRMRQPTDDELSKQEAKRSSFFSN